MQSCLIVLTACLASSHQVQIEDSDTPSSQALWTSPKLKGLAPYEVNLPKGPAPDGVNLLKGPAPDGVNLLKGPAPDGVEKTKDVERKFIPRGTNQQKSFLDSVRMPGTNWCGKGWRTDSFNKLGGFSTADRCCREHDMGCAVSIQPGQKKFGLLNVRFHTVMHCDCDDRFYSCLKMSETPSGNIVGNLFFNLANIPCFIFQMSEVCTKWSFWGRCLDYEYKETAVWRKPFPY